jgi:hypothetical protein
MNRFLSMGLVLGLSLAAVQAADKVVKLKLGTLAPTGTSYHKSLQAMGENGGAKSRPAACNSRSSLAAHKGVNRTWWGSCRRAI